MGGQRIQHDLMPTFPECTGLFKKVDATEVCFFRMPFGGGYESERERERLGARLGGENCVT